MSVFRIANPGRQFVLWLNLEVSFTSGCLGTCLVYWFSALQVTHHGPEEIHLLRLTLASNSASAATPAPKPRCVMVLSFSV